MEKEEVSSYQQKTNDRHTSHIQVGGGVRIYEPTLLLPMNEGLLTLPMLKDIHIFSTCDSLTIWCSDFKGEVKIQSFASLKKLKMQVGGPN